MEYLFVTLAECKARCAGKGQEEEGRKGHGHGGDLHPRAGGAGGPPAGPKEGSQSAEGRHCLGSLPEKAKVSPLLHYLSPCCSVMLSIAVRLNTWPSLHVL